MHPPGWRVLHYDKEHVLGAVDHEIDAGSAVPFDLAERTWRRRHRVAGIGADAEAVAEPKAVAGKIEIIASDTRSPADVIGRHRREGYGAEIGLAVKFPAIEQHLPKTGKIGDGRDHAAAAGFPSRDIERISLDMAVPGQRPRGAGPLGRARQEEIFGGRAQAAE